jgi:hypothetical protein
MSDLHATTYPSAPLPVPALGSGVSVRTGVGVAESRSGLGEPQQGKYRTGT